MQDETSKTEEAPSRAKIWMTAVRPFAYTASVLAVVLGLALSYCAGHPINWARFIVTLLGVVLFHTAANLLNDCFDHRRGLDSEVLPMSGAVVRGWLSERQVFSAAMLCLVAGATCGLLLTWKCGWEILIFGAIGCVIAIGYTTARFCFKYNGLGDFSIFLAFGVLPVFGTYWVQAQSFSWQPILWSIPLCFYTVAIVHANNWHDIDSDKDARCITPAVLLGSRGAGVYYRLLILAPYAMIVTAIIVTRLVASLPAVPVMTALTLLSVPIAVNLARVKPAADSPAFAMLDGKTAQLHTAFGVLLVVGLVLDRMIFA